MTAGDWDGVTYATLAGEDRVPWAEPPADAAGGRPLTARRFWSRVLAEAIGLSRRGGTERVVVRDHRGPEADIDAATWAAVVETPAGERPADLTAPAERFGMAGRAEAFAHAARLRDTLAALGYDAGG